MRVITTLDLDNLLIEAKQSPRKRAILRLHEHEEAVQRMFNALQPGTYIAPHKHEKPDKVELMSLLKGRVAVLQMTALGEVEQIVILEERGNNRVLEIPPRTFHTVIALEPAVLLEIIQGPYIAATHKQFAAWAPLEDNPKARDYLLYLESIVHNAV
jgi:cupin fold WbuC family metalloprotein